MKYEIRSAPQPVKLEGRTLSGYAIVWNALSHDLGGFRERFLPGSVTEAVSSGQMEAWAHHDHTKPLGSQAGGSLRLKEDATGLAYDLDLPDTSYANDLKALMSGGRKDIGGTSFGFMVDGENGQNWKREN